MELYFKKLTNLCDPNILYVFSFFTLFYYLTALELTMQSTSYNKEVGWKNLSVSFKITNMGDLFQIQLSLDLKVLLFFFLMYRSGLNGK